MRSRFCNEESRAGAKGQRIRLLISGTGAGKCITFALPSAEGRVSDAVYKSIYIRSYEFINMYPSVHNKRAETQHNKRRRVTDEQR